MRRHLAVYLILLIGCIATQAQKPRRHRTSPTPSPTPVSRPTPVPDPEGWVTFNSELGRFSILMPEIPADQTEVVETDDRPYTAHLFTVKSTNSLFRIAWVDYDPSFVFIPALELQASRDKFLKGIQGTLVSNQISRIDGYQTLEFTAETIEMVFKSRVFIVGRRPYIFVARTPKNIDDTINVNRFFGSLKFRR